jgi:hypothetical protein
MEQLMAEMSKTAVKPIKKGKNGLRFAFGSSSVMLAHLVA